MSDSSSEAKSPGLPAPHHLYEAAETDSRIVIRFLGNRAVVIDASFLRVDPFQMLAAAKWLEYQAMKQISMSEMAEEKLGIRVADQLPTMSPFEAIRRAGGSQA